MSYVDIGLGSCGAMPDFAWRLQSPMTESLKRVSPAHRRPPSNRLQEKGRTGEDIYPPVLL